MISSRIFHRKCLSSLLLLVLLPCIPSSQDIREKVFDNKLKSVKDIEYTGPEFIHTVSILTNINRNKVENGIPKMVRCFTKFMDSIFEHSWGNWLHLMLITDTQSIQQVEKVIKNSLGQYLSEAVLRVHFHFTPKYQIKTIPERFQVEFLDLESFTVGNRAQIDEMKEYFSSKTKDIHMVNDEGVHLVYAYEKYKLDLFFLGPFYHLSFPDTMKRIIVLDIDLEVKTDLERLEYEFQSMGENQIIGVATDQFDLYAPFYKHNIDKFSKDFDWGMRIKGLNTGVVNYDLEKMRKNKVYEEMLNLERYGPLSDKYSLHGMLGDQDYLTLLSWEHPELFYILDCSFNTQRHPLQGISCKNITQILHLHGST